MLPTRNSNLTQMLKVEHNITHGRSTFYRLHRNALRCDPPTVYCRLGQVPTTSKCTRGFFENVIFETIRDCKSNRIYNKYSS